MLVLSRKPGQDVVIEGRIRVSVIRIKAGKVRLGIEAPSGIKILRAELRASHNCPHASGR